MRELTEEYREGFAAGEANYTNLKAANESNIDTIGQQASRIRKLHESNNRQSDIIYDLKVQRDELRDTIVAMDTYKFDPEKLDVIWRIQQRRNNGNSTI